MTCTILLSYTWLYDYGLIGILPKLQRTKNNCILSNFITGKLTHLHYFISHLREVLFLLRALEEVGLLSLFPKMLLHAQKYICFMYGGRGRCNLLKGLCPKPVVCSGGTVVSKGALSTSSGPPSNFVVNQFPQLTLQRGWLNPHIGPGMPQQRLLPTTPRTLAEFDAVLDEAIIRI